MRKLTLVAVLLALGTTLVVGQEEDPIPPRRTKAAKMGFFGGFTPGWLFVDVEPINKFLQNSGGAAFKEDGVFMFGGAGAAYIMFVPNLRVGGLGMGGTISSTSLDGQNLRRDADLNVSLAGVTVEYVVPIVTRLDVSFGVMLGGGGLDLTLRQDNGGNSRWDEEWKYFGGDPTARIYNLTRKYSGSYFVWVPSVNIEYALLGWVGVRLGASYVGMSAPSWQVDDQYDLLGVPDDVHGKGFMLQAGFFVGTF